MNCVQNRRKIMSRCCSFDNNHNVNSKDLSPRQSVDVGLPTKSTFLPTNTGIQNTNLHTGILFNDGTMMTKNVSSENVDQGVTNRAIGEKRISLENSNPLGSIAGTSNLGNLLCNPDKLNIDDAADHANNDNYIDSMEQYMWTPSPRYRAKTWFPNEVQLANDLFQNTMAPFEFPHHGGNFSQPLNYAGNFRGHLIQNYSPKALPTQTPAAATSPISTTTTAPKPKRKHSCRIPELVHITKRKTIDIGRIIEFEDDKSDSIPSMDIFTNRISSGRKNTDDENDHDDEDNKKPASRQNEVADRHSDNYDCYTNNYSLVTVTTPQHTVTPRVDNYSANSANMENASIDINDEPKINAAAFSGRGKIANDVANGVVVNVDHGNTMMNTDDDDDVDFIYPESCIGLDRKLGMKKKKKFAEDKDRKKFVRDRGLISVSRRKSTITYRPILSTPAVFRNVTSQYVQEGGDVRHDGLFAKGIMRRCDNYMNRHHNTEIFRSVGPVLLTNLHTREDLLCDDEAEIMLQVNDNKNGEQRSITSHLRLKTHFRTEFLSANLHGADGYDVSMSKLVEPSKIDTAILADMLVDDVNNLAHYTTKERRLLKSDTTNLCSPEFAKVHLPCNCGQDWHHNPIQRQHHGAINRAAKIAAQHYRNNFGTHEKLLQQQHGGTKVAMVGYHGNGHDIDNTTNTKKNYCLNCKFYCNERIVANYTGHGAAVTRSCVLNSSEIQNANGAKNDLCTKKRQEQEHLENTTTLHNCSNNDLDYLDYTHEHLPKMATEDWLDFWNPHFSSLGDCSLDIMTYHDCDDKNDITNLVTQSWDDELPYQHHHHLYGETSLQNNNMNPEDVATTKGKTAVSDHCLSRKEQGNSAMAEKTQRRVVAHHYNTDTVFNDDKDHKDFINTAAVMTVHNIGSRKLYHDWQNFDTSLHRGSNKLHCHSAAAEVMRNSKTDVLMASQSTAASSRNLLFENASSRKDYTSSKISEVPPIMSEICQNSYTLSRKSEFHFTNSTRRLGEENSSELLQNVGLLRSQSAPPELEFGDVTTMVVVASSVGQVADNSVYIENMATARRDYKKTPVTTSDHNNVLYRSVSEMLNSKSTKDTAAANTAGEIRSVSLDRLNKAEQADNKSTSIVLPSNLNRSAAVTISSSENSQKCSANLDGKLKLGMASVGSDSLLSSFATPNCRRFTGNFIQVEKTAISNPKEESKNKILPTMPVGSNQNGFILSSPLEDPLGVGGMMSCNTQQQTLPLCSSFESSSISTSNYTPREITNSWDLFGISSNALREHHFHVCKTNTFDLATSSDCKFPHSESFPHSFPSTKVQEKIPIGNDEDNQNNVYSIDITTPGQ